MFGDSVTSPNFLLKVTKKRCACVRASVCWKGAHACECVCVGANLLVGCASPLMLFVIL